jgi:lathosterol oxidase
MSDATGHRSLLQLVSGPVLARFVDAETIRYVTGQGGTLASQILGLLSTWALFYVALIAFYFTFCRAAMAYCAWKYPKAPTNAVPERLVANMIAVSHRAFPLYVTVRPCAAKNAATFALPP